MALRVLLADESSTIKKVFQLALQDFAVDVRPVNIGVDVVSVAQAFKPDIIFADVLLQKKNGYEVALEIKQHPTLKNTPVVLMWSGFVELDEDKYQASLSNAQLEKPFDVAALRKLVTDLVPRTQSQRISQFLTFPQMPEMAESQPPPVASAGAGGARVTPEPEEDFQQVPIPKVKGDQAGKFRLNLKPEELDPDAVPVDYDVPAGKISAEEVFQAGAGDTSSPDVEAEEEEFSFREPQKASKQAALPDPDDLELDEDLIEEPTPTETKPAISAPAAGGLSEAQLEKIIRAQSADIIESVVWKVVPELAKQIIERELNRLLKERDSHL
jgi:two-component system, cell cycle response regulator